uniref:Large ribosomal subunit protein eL28 n=1 Tax=Panagrellus redivivus TaxID=6233 RepID=A0A7E4VQL1_PANRE
MGFKNTSKDLVWQVIRNNSSFLRTQRGINKKFSTERFNPAGINSARYNGLINTAGVHVSVDADKKIVVVTKNKNKASYPAKSTSTVTVRATRNAVRTAGNNAKAANPELKKATQLRTSQLVYSLKTRKPKTAAAAAVKTEA